MQIETTRFGLIEVNDSSVIEAPTGLLGFEQCRRFVLLEDKPGSHFKWLQAVEQPGVAFIVTNPLEFFPDYEVELSDEQSDSLGLTDPLDAVVLTTITVGPQSGVVTTNLVGPILINARALRARQVVLGDERYGSKHVIGHSSNACPATQRAMVA